MQYTRPGGVRNTKTGTRESITQKVDVKLEEGGTSHDFLGTLERFKSRDLSARDERGQQSDLHGSRGRAPISHGLLPALQPCDLAHLEPKNPRTVSLRAQRDRGRIDGVAEAVRALHELVARTPAPARVVHGRAGARHEAAHGARAARGVRRAALGREEGGVDEVEEVREGRAEVRAVDRAVAGRLGRVDVLASPAVQLDRLLVRHVRQPDRQQRLPLAEHPRAASEIGFFVLV